MPKHNTEKGALKSNSSLTLKHKRTNIGILFQKSKISKTKGFNKDGNTKNKKYHHQEDSNNETTQKTKKGYKHSNIYVLQQLVIYTIEKRLIKSELSSYIDI